jgi:hypothetical protein
MTKTQGFVENRIEHRLQFARRGIDDLQDFGGRGLPLQRFAGLGQEPRILHGNDRLRGEVLQQRDLLVREGPYLLPVDHERPEKVVILAQRHGKESTAATQFNSSAAECIARQVRFFLRSVGDMHHGLSTQQTAMRVVRSDRMRALSSQKVRVRGWYATQPRWIHLAALVGPKDAIGGVA